MGESSFLSQFLMITDIKTITIYSCTYRDILYC